MIIFGNLIDESTPAQISTDINDFNNIYGSSSISVKTQPSNSVNTYVC